MKVNYVFKIVILCWALVTMACKAQFSSQVYTEKQIVDASMYSNNLGYKAFRSGFYQFAQTQGCVKCHETQSPQFASHNIDHAYEEAKEILDVENPLNTKFIEYAGNLHCNEPPCSDPVVRPLVTQLVSSWSEAELAGGEPIDDGQGSLSNILFKTAQLKVPTTIPNMFATTPGVLRFSLGSLKPAVPGLETAILEIEITMMNNNIYKLAKPRIIGSSKQIKFKQMYVLIKESADPAVIGTEDKTFAANWHNVDFTAPVVAMPSPMPTGPVVAATPLATVPLYYKTTTRADYFVIGFADIK